MHDDDKLKLARECSAKVSEEQGYHGTATATRNGKRDDFDSVQCALAAINALDPQLVEAVGLLRAAEKQLDSGYRTEGARIMRDRISAFLAKQGDA
mgnify:CR=1 FL=1